MKTAKTSQTKKKVGRPRKIKAESPKKTGKVGRPKKVKAANAVTPEEPEVNETDNEDGTTTKKTLITFAEWKASVKRLTTDVNPLWTRDPAYKYFLSRTVRGALDAMQIRIAMNNRNDSPTEDNPIQLNEENLFFITAMADNMQRMETEAKSTTKKILQQSDIGRWILDQPGLGTGWLGGCVLSMLPDIYDAAICNECGKYLLRTKDLEFFHTPPPKKRSGEDSKDKCKFDNTLMSPENYHIHERKPSTFVNFAGLATVPGYACGHCHYLLKWNSEKKCYTHPAYQNLPKGQKKCKYNDTKWFPRKEDGIPVFDGVEGVNVCTSIKIAKGEKRPYNAQLRAKLIGKNGVADAFLRAKHPVYYAIYSGYKHHKSIQQPYKSLGWLDMMAKRKMCSQFLIDLFIKWRTLEGLPCRPSYAEEKLGIVHHP